jgi:hypothetical protein
MLQDSNQYEMLWNPKLLYKLFCQEKAVTVELLQCYGSSFAIL